MEEVRSNENACGGFVAGSRSSGLLSAEVLHASTVGRDNYAESEASVAKLDLTVGGNTIKMDPSGVAINGTQVQVQGSAQVSISAPMVGIN